MIKTIKEKKYGRPRTYPVLSLSALNIDGFKTALKEHKKIHVKDLGLFTIKRLAKRKVQMNRWKKVVLTLPSRNKLCFQSSKEFKKFIQTIKK